MAGLDHIVHCTSDFEATRQQMTRLGFTLTPPAEHPFGTGNCLVQLDGFFLEFVHIANPQLVKPGSDKEFSFAQFNQDFLSGGQGVSMLVMESADARADQAYFDKVGLDTYAPFDFSRQAELPTGDTVTVGFSLAFVTHADMPRATFFTCQQHAPEHFWKPEFQRHANMATSISEVAMVAERPLHYAKFVNLLTGIDAEVSETNLLRTQTARGAFSIYDPQRFADTYAAESPVGGAPQFAGYTIEVMNREATLAHHEANGVRWFKTPSGHSVDPDITAGAVLAFSEVL